MVEKKGQETDGLKEAEFEFGLLTHHILVPLGFKNQIDLCRSDPFYTLDFLLDIFDNEIGCRTN